MFMGSQSARREYERRINKAIDFIAVHLIENPSLDEIAAAASFSKFHFHRLFQAHVGETVLEFTRRLRLEKAASQLHFDRTKDITSIALDCGFSSSQNFAKAFKKHFTVSPTAYREHDVYGRDQAISKDGNIIGKNGNASNGEIDHGHVGYQNDPNDEKEMIVSVDVEIKEMPELNVAYVRVVGEYKHDSIKVGFQKLMKWATPRGLVEGGVSMGMAWDNPYITPAEKCRYDACITVPEGTVVDGEVQTQKVPVGRYAIHRHEAFNNDFQQGWDDLIKNWLPSSGYQPGDGPSYEVVIESGADDPKGRWLVDIHLPVKPL